MVQQRPNQTSSAVQPKLKVFLVLQRSQFGSHRHSTKLDPALMQVAALGDTELILTQSA